MLACLRLTTLQQIITYPGQSKQNYFTISFCFFKKAGSQYLCIRCSFTKSALFLTASFVYYRGRYSKCKIARASDTRPAKEALIQQSSKSQLEFSSLTCPSHSPLFFCLLESLTVLVYLVKTIVFEIYKSVGFDQIYAQEIKALSKTSVLFICIVSENFILLQSGD